MSSPRLWMRVLVVIALGTALAMFMCSRPTAREVPSVRPITTSTASRVGPVEVATSRTVQDPEPAPSAQPEARPEFGRMIVDVSGEGRGPVAEARVVLKGTAEATTDSNGHCELNLTARWSGYVAVVADGFPPWRGDEVSCELGETVKMSVRLIRGSDIRVRVVTPDDAPLAGANVDLMADHNTEGRWCRDLHASGTTNPEGVATFRNLIAIPDSIVARLQGYVTKRESIGVNAAVEPSEYKVVLAPSRNVTVRVTNVDAGQPCRGLPVVVRREKGFHREIDMFTTDEHGEFRVDAPVNEVLSIDEGPDAKFEILSDRKFPGSEARIELVARLARNYQCIVRRLDDGPVTDVLIDYWYPGGRHSTEVVTTVGGACSLRDQTTQLAPYFRVVIPGYGSSGIDRSAAPGIRPDPYIAIVRPELTVIGTLIDHRRDPVPFTTVRVRRVQAVHGLLMGQGTHEVTSVPTDRNGRFRFSLPSDDPYKRYVVMPMPKQATAPHVFLCYGPCETTSGFGPPRTGAPPDVRTLPNGAETVDLGAIQCFPNATATIRVVAPKHRPPFRVWLTPTGDNERSLSLVAGGTDETGTVVFSGLAPGTYFTDALRGSRESKPPLWLNSANRTKVTLQPGDNGVLEIPFSFK